MVQLTELVTLLVDAPALAALRRPSRRSDAVRRQRYRTGHAQIAEADIEFLVDAVHAGNPEATDPVAIEAMDRLARLIQIGANIADGGFPLPPNLHL